jgi:hypothetical protein
MQGNRSYAFFFFPIHCLLFFMSWHSIFNFPLGENHNLTSQGKTHRLDASHFCIADTKGLILSVSNFEDLMYHRCAFEHSL